MANWKHTIDMQPEWKQSQDGQGSVRAVIQKLSHQCEAMPAHLRDSELEDVLCSFQNLLDNTPEDEDVDADEFDYVWSELYDWADEKKVWIKTAF